MAAIPVRCFATQRDLSFGPHYIRNLQSMAGVCPWLGLERIAGVLADFGRQVSKSQPILLIVARGHKSGATAGIAGIADNAGNAGNVDNL